MKSLINGTFLLVLLAGAANATTIQCTTGVDVGQAISSAIQSGTPVELDPGSGKGWAGPKNPNGTICLTNQSMNFTGIWAPFLDCHNAQFSANTGQFAIIDGTGSGNGVLRNCEFTSNGNNPSKLFLRLGPIDHGQGVGGVCDSNIGQWTVADNTFCLQNGCNANLRGTGTIGIDIEMSEENYFPNNKWGQADTPIRIIGDMGGYDWSSLRMPSAYVAPCIGRHSAVGNAFSSGQYAATQTSAVMLYGGAILSTVFDDGVLLSQPTNGILPGLPTAAITNMGYYSSPWTDSEWTVQSPRIERFTSLWSGPLPANSVYQALSVPLGVGTAVSTPAPTSSPGTPSPSASPTPQPPSGGCQPPSTPTNSGMYCAQTDGCGCTYPNNICLTFANGASGFYCVPPGNY